MATIPEAGIFDDDSVTIALNHQWLTLMDGLYGQMLEPGFFEGDEAAIYDAQQQVYQLLKVIGYPPPPPIQTLFGVAVPTYDGASGATAGNVGTRFTVDVDGFILGIRHYRLSGSGNGNQGRIYINNVPASGLVDFPDDVTGWTFAEFDDPIAVSPSYVYSAVVFAPSGNIPYKLNYFTSPLIVGNLTSPQDNPSGQRNGTYDTNGAPSYPFTGISAVNWFVDVEFQAAI